MNQERRRLESIERIRAAEAAEKERIETEQDWADSKSWVADALRVQDELQSQAKTQRLSDQIKLETAITDLDEEG